MTPLAEALATVQPAWGRSRGGVVVVVVLDVDVEVVVVPADVASTTPVEMAASTRATRTP